MAIEALEKQIPKKLIIWEERYLNGESFYEISKDYDCYHQTVLHHLRKVKIYKEKGVIQDGH